MKRQRSDDRLANRAIALARAAAAERRTGAQNIAASTDIPVRTAVYLALGGAHVAVTNADGMHRVDCEACGPLNREPGHRGWWSDDAIPNQCGQKHAETCRRLPERLWPNGGAS